MVIKKCLIKAKAFDMLSKSTNCSVFLKRWKETWQEYLRQIGMRTFWMKLLNWINKWGWIQLFTTFKNCKDLSTNSIKSISNSSICFSTNSHLSILIKINIRHNCHQTSIKDIPYPSLMLNSLWCAKITTKSGKFQPKN